MQESWHYRNRPAYTKGLATRDYLRARWEVKAKSPPHCVQREPSSFGLHSPAIISRSNVVSLPRLATNVQHDTTA